MDSQRTGEAPCDLGTAHTVFLATIALYQTPVNAECLEQPDEHVNGQGLRQCGKEHTFYKPHPCCAAQGSAELQGVGVVH